MKTTITLDRTHLWQMIQALSLNADNKIWLAERLISEAQKEKESRQCVAEPPCRYGVEEARRMLEDSERRFADGEYISEEEMDKYLQNLA